MMKQEFDSIALIKNQEERRFEIYVDGYLAFIDYRETRGQITLVHTESAPELAGRGVASALVEKTLIWIEQNAKTLFPFCPYVFAYIKRHPEWKRVVDKRFKAYDKL